MTLADGGRITSDCRRSEVRQQFFNAFVGPRWQLAEHVVEVGPGSRARQAWLTTSGLLPRQRAAAVMSLVQLAKLSGHDPWAYLKDILERLPTHLDSLIEDAAVPADNLRAEESIPACSPWAIR